MQKILLFFFFLLLAGCSLNNPFVTEEVDKVTVVQYTPYMKHHRAYFSRIFLHTIENKKKYVYLHNAKTNDIAVLLYSNDNYLLYNMSTPAQKPLSLHVTPSITYKKALNEFRKKGFSPITSLASVGYTTSVSPKKYKGIKTLLIETKEYSKLWSLYKKSIRTYDASKIKNIKTKLPKILISSYYKHYENLSSTKMQRLQLSIIAKKLGLKSPILIKKQKVTHINKPIIIKKTKVPQIKQHKMPSRTHIKKSISTPSKIEPSYSYYLHQAPLNELATYISNKATKNLLSYNQYNMLSKRKIQLQEEKLLKQGSLEELIAAYKVKKNPKYKQRIMSLMKDKQQNQ